MENKIAPPPPAVIEIFTQEQLMVLPQEAKDSIINLGNNLPQKELMVLNPLVVELLKIKELAKIKYNPLPEEPTKEDIKAHKENIELYKNAKKSITALTQQNATAKKAIKGPLDTLGKQVLTIEKSVNTIAKEVLDTIQLTFKPYLDAEAERVRLAAIAKEEKEKAVINNLTQENVDVSNKFKKSTLTTFLRYEMLGPTKLEVENAIDNYALDKLFLLRDSIKIKNFEAYAVGQDLTLLDEEELEEIKIFFIKEIESFSKSINVRITALQALDENKTLTDRVETINDTIAETRGSNFTSPIGMTNIFDLATSTEQQTFGKGANQEMVPKFVWNEKDKDPNLFDLVFNQLDDCTATIQFILDKYKGTKPQFNDFEKENIRRVTGGIELLKRTKLYILNQLTPKAN
jgi:hypothetical protein